MLETNHEGKVTTAWNQKVQTDRTIPNNKPDIIISDSKSGTCMLINVAISEDGNVIKILKNECLTVEIEQRNGRARNQGTAENRHIWHCMHTSESTDCKSAKDLTKETTVHVP